MSGGTDGDGEICSGNLMCWVGFGSVAVKFTALEVPLGCVSRSGFRSCSRVLIGCAFWKWGSACKLSSKAQGAESSLIR